MQYKKMIPAQIREAIAKNYPVALTIGNLEYHSEHLPLGTDGAVTEGIVDRLEERHPEMVVLPPFYYGTTSFAVAGPEDGKGSVSIDSMIVSQLAENLFMNLLEVGFRNIHGFVYHQSENFDQGMPLDLAFRFAGRRAVFAFLEQKRGRGWWGDESMKNYYEDNNVFDWIQIHPVVDVSVSSAFGGDHAGKIETSAIMDIWPETVQMDKWHDADWYAGTAKEATPELGHQYITASVDVLEKMLFGKVSS